ncbi:MAG TPA: ADP-ribosylglycohydrolase family protein, partial [Anaerolineaceae bacterium]
MDTTTLDRLLGCAIGAAVGDALGMPLEFGPARPIDDLARTYVAGRLAAGSFTDDTEMALALAESLVDRGGFDGVDLSARFLDWYHHNPPDVGNQTRLALAWLEDGLDWETASRRMADRNPDG